jgi:putative redox protein
MKTSIECTWKQDMAFEAEVQGHKIIMDSTPEHGGHESGPRPKPLLLVALAGCTGMDVIPLLKKMRAEPEYFKMTIEGEPREEHPKYYHKIHVIYEFGGANLDMEKIEKAVSLSRERYCSVSAMLKMGAEMTYEIRIRD